MDKRQIAFAVFLVFCIILVAVAAVLAIIVSTDDAAEGNIEDFSTTPSTPIYEQNWWKKYPIYQVYPRSFQDSDGDGIGDLNGITSRLDYFVKLGIKTIWLNPIYESPQYDMGYDISNFTAIDPQFGTMEDFDNLVAAVHEKGMCLVLDFVPNHSSFEHPWFVQSKKGVEPYSDYYIWRNASKDGSYPNNWLSVFGNSSWEWSPERNQYYLHEFLIEQPDLNYRNPELRVEMANAMNFWLEKGCDGFRMDAVIFLVENATFPDEPRDTSHPDALKDEYNYLRHIYTVDQPETYTVVEDWVKNLKSFGEKIGKHIFMVTEGYTDVDHVMQYYKIGVDFPFNFNLIKLNGQTTAPELSALVRDWLDHMPYGRGYWPNWVLGNHDNHRISSRMGGDKYTDIMNMLILLLPGTPTVYYGDEIGMVDTFIPYNKTVDTAGKKWGPELYMNFSRDPERTPMQWDSGLNAGFSSNKTATWLPVNDNYAKGVNVEDEWSDPRSHLNIFAQLLKLRLEKTFQVSGENCLVISVRSDEIFALSRYWDGEPSYGLAINIGDKTEPSDLDISRILPYTVQNATVVLSSGGSSYKAGDILLNILPVPLKSGEGIVIKF